MNRATPLLVSVALTACASPAVCAPEAMPWVGSRQVQYFAVRLRPKADLLGSLQGFAKDHGLRAAFVASCVGSATRASVRYANQPSASTREGHFEIVSLSGTLAQEGGHLHVGFADSTGATFGGHLMEGTTIYTTAEIVLGELRDVAFSREPDSTYGYRELVPLPRTTRVPRPTR